MEKLRGMGMIVGVVFVMLSTVGCKKEVILDPKNEIITDTVTKASSVVRHVIQVQNPGDNKDIQPSILTAVNKAVDGDTIMLPGGNFVFSGTITISKCVSIQGKGIAKTVLYRSETVADASLTGPIFNFVINRDTASHLIISGITFKSKKPADLNNLNGSLAIDQGIQIKNAVDFIITNCRFENFGFAGITIYHKDNLARGLICNNQFYHNFKGDHRGYGFGVDIEGGNSTWIPVVNFGTNNFIYIEENTFDYHFQAINGNTGALFVARYNKINNNWIDAAINMHEAYKPGTFPCRAAEIYYNTINATKFGNGSSKSLDIVPGHSKDELFVVAISPKGGDALIYNDTISGYQYAIHVTAFPKYFNDINYPVHYNLGYKSGVKYGIDDLGVSKDRGDGDGFFWNNTLVTYQGYIPKLFVNWQPTWLKEERDYHFSAKPGYVPYTYPHPLKSRIK
jgi:hypothetical protein